MKNLFIICFVVLAFSFDVSARLALIPLNELIKDSDLIVVGTLTAISEKSEDFVIRGTGEIVIEKIIAGNVKTSKGFPLKFGDRLQLNYIEGFACVYGSHKRIENEKGIFLLTVNDKEEIQYENFSPLDDSSEIKKLLQRGIKPNNIAKLIKIRNDAEQTSLTPSVEISENQNSETSYYTTQSSKSRAKEYSPFRAFLVILASIFLYYFLYRSRFKIR